MNKSRVGETVLARRRVDLYIPKLAKVSLFLFAANIRVRPRMMNRLFCESVHIFSSPPKALSMLKDSFSFFDADISAFNSHRYGSSFLIAFASAPVISSQRLFARLFLPESFALKWS